MKVYIVQKSIVGPIHWFGFDISDTLEFNGEILGVFGSENDAYKLVDELVKKDYEEYGINPDDEDRVEEYNTVFHYEVVKREVK